ncbi:C-C motif chemokine 4-like [Protopterus annectens]|uniref:C-C motif chemokine 4-like n=1 Tax=Protopterus annectens TaxID=7888 RepID=UPI001CFB3B8F|nr:C-C motif chemokine 4-like [Protopterus annectens]
MSSIYRICVALILCAFFMEIHCLTKADAPQACCFSYTSAVIPRKQITDYYRTSTMCSNPAIVFKTKKRAFCVNPDLRWVKSFLTYIEAMKATPMSDSAK